MQLKGLVGLSRLLSRVSVLYHSEAWTAPALALSRRAPSARSAQYVPPHPQASAPDDGRRRLTRTTR
eukprot:scaffold7968_cov2622-Prasinococcus_capsulatus_cf.AAC.1